jgi:hypothetical protein
VSHRNTLVFTLLLAATVFLASSVSAQSLFTSQTPEFTDNVKTVLFPFDIHNRMVNPDTLDANAAWLKQHPDAHFWIQGRADNRGDVVYNLALSYRRAQFVKSNLLKKGVSDSQIGLPPDGANSIRFAKRMTSPAGRRIAVWTLFNRTTRCS